MKWKLLPPGLSMLLLLLGSCAPRSMTKVLKTYPPQTAYADFMIFETTDTLMSSGAEKLGEIVLNQSFGPECDYLLVLDTATAIARSWGANALKIDSHRLPTNALKGLSTCHRVKATAYRLSDLEQQLKSIVWDERRQLRVADFRADTANRPFIAATLTSIRVYWELRPSQKEAIVQARATFDRRLSYFKYRRDSVDVLMHEQGHFDIAEIYARKLRKDITGRTFSLHSWSEEIRQLYDANFQEMQKFQDHYDHDVYADPKQQKRWLAEIQAGLNTYRDYRQEKLVLQLKP